MERGEVDIVGAYGLPGILVSQPGWVDKGEAVILYQASLKRHRLMPNVPTLPELATSDEGRVVLRAAASTGEFGRSILTTPGVPAERLAALRTAFAAMLKDPDFLAAAEKRKHDGRSRHRRGARRAGAGNAEAAAARWPSRSAR